MDRFQMGKTSLAISSVEVCLAGCHRIFTSMVSDLSASYAIQDLG